MKNMLKPVIIVGSVALILFIISFFVNDRSNELETYIVDAGFENYNGTYIYTKQVSKNDMTKYNEEKVQGKNSEYEKLHFNIDSYELTKDKITYQDSIEKNITPTYHYKDDTISYTYRVIYNYTSIIIDGTYDTETKEFTCESTYAYQINMVDSKDAICDKIKTEIELFENEAKLLIQDADIIKYMKR